MYFRLAACFNTITAENKNCTVLNCVVYAACASVYTQAKK